MFIRLFSFIFLCLYIITFTGIYCTLIYNILYWLIVYYNFCAVERNQPTASWIGKWILTPSPRPRNTPTLRWQKSGNLPRWRNTNRKQRPSYRGGSKGRSLHLLFIENSPLLYLSLWRRGGNLIKKRSFDSHYLRKPHTEVRSGDLSIMHDNNVITRRKLSGCGSIVRWLDSPTILL